MSNFNELWSGVQAKFDEVFSSRTSIVPKVVGDFGEIDDPENDAVEMIGIITQAMNEKGLPAGVGSSPRVRLAGTEIMVCYDLGLFASSDDWPKRGWIIENLDREETYRVLFSQSDGKGRVNVRCVIA